MSDILDPLKSASANSLQRTLGSTIFDDAIAEVERLRGALDEISRKYSNGASADTLAWIARATLAKKE